MTLSRTVGSSISAIAMSFFVPVMARAQVADAIRSGLNAAAKPSGYLGGETKPVVIIGNVLNALLGFMGIVLVLYFLYGGFLYMTSSGDSKKVESAKDTIKNAVIGMIIIVTAFALTTFVLEALANAFGAGGAAGTPVPVGMGGPTPPPATSP